MRQTFTNGKLGSVERGSSGKNPRGKIDAESVAVAALAFLAADEDRLLTFLNVSGLQIDDLRAASQTPGFLSSVLDHLSSDERLAAAFAVENGYSPETLEAARAALARVWVDP